MKTQCTIDIYIKNLGHSLKLQIVKFWKEEDGHPDTIEILVEFGYYFDNEEEINVFKKGKLFKSIFKAIQKY